MLLIIKAGLILNIGLTLKCNHATSHGPVKSARAAFWIYVIVIVLDMCLYMFICSWSLISVREDDSLPETCGHVHEQEVSTEGFNIAPVYTDNVDDSGPHAGDNECEASFYNPKWVFGASLFLICLVLIKVYFASLMWQYAKFQAEHQAPEEEEKKQVELTNDIKSQKDDDGE